MRLWIAAIFILGCQSAEAQSIQPLPNGRLGLSQTTRWSGDITGASTIYYTNDQVEPFPDTGPWAPNTQYDEFFSGSGICHQAWTSRSGGALPTPTICTGIYIGSEQTDANGQFSQQKSPGTKRRWDIWNAYNQKQIDLQVVDSDDNQQFVGAQSNWTPVSASSYATFIIGLPEDASCLYLQQVYPLAAGFVAPNKPGSSWGMTACGWGAQFANPVNFDWAVPLPAAMPPGTYGQQGADNWAGGTVAPGGTAIADYTAVDAVGVQIVYSIICANQGNSWVKYMGKNPPVERIMHIRFPG